MNTCALWTFIELVNIQFKKSWYCITISLPITEKKLICSKGKCSIGVRKCLSFRVATTLMKNGYEIRSFEIQNFETFFAKIILFKNHEKSLIYNSVLVF